MASSVTWPAGSRSILIQRLAGEPGLAGLVNYDKSTKAYALQLELGTRLRQDTAEAADLRALADCLGKFAKEFLSEAPPKRP